MTNAILTAGFMDGSPDEGYSRTMRAGVCAAEDGGPWERLGFRPVRRGNGALKQVLYGLYVMGAWVAMPVAVLTCHGWLGLLVHGIALSGAAGLLQLQGMAPLEGERACDGGSDGR